MNPTTAGDTFIRNNLFPFTLSRQVADIRIGILTLREKWDHLCSGTPMAGVAENTLQENIIPSRQLADAIQNNRIGEALPFAKTLEYPWQIFQYNDEQLRLDFELVTKGRQSQPISSSNKTIDAANIFLEEDAKIEHCILNASTGPIYIGKNAEIMEGSMIRGPFALCEGGLVKMGTKIYGATTVGPYSIVGGEIKNSVIFGYSSKAHDGYLGDSVIGEWCNFGAGTSNSNIKNNAREVYVWNERQNKYLNAGLKCGVLMGDYSRCAINTSFNTGTIVGVCCNVFGEGLTPKYLPSFSWGYKPFAKYEFEKALQDISNWKKLKNHSLSDSEVNTLKHIFEQV